MSESSPTRRQLREAARAQRTRGLAQAGADKFSIAQAVGGPRGAIETVTPGVVFIVLYTLTRNLTLSLAVAVGVALAAVVARVVTRSSPMQAFSGTVGVAFCAFFAVITGDARNFFAPGFLLNIGYGLVCLISTLPFPRMRLPGSDHYQERGPYPAIGLLLGPLTGEGLHWRSDRRRRRAYQLVTWMWAAFFTLRLAVQLPLYFADKVGALGTARLVMGLPLFGLTVWLTWFLLKRVPLAVVPEPATPDEPGAGSDGEAPSLVKQPDVRRGQGSAAS